MKANRAIRVPVIHQPDGERWYWRIWYVPRAWNCGGNCERAKFISGWTYESHDGVERFAEGNWSDLVRAFQLTAENYGATTTLS